MNKKLQTKIDIFRSKVGYKIALGELIEAGISKSAAQKLLAGTYISDPKRLLLRAIESVIGE